MIRFINIYGNFLKYNYNILRILFKNIFEPLGNFNRYSYAIFNLAQNDLYRDLLSWTSFLCASVHDAISRHQLAVDFFDFDGGWHYSQFLNLRGYQCCSIAVGIWQSRGRDASWRRNPVGIRLGMESGRNSTAIRSDSNSGRIVARFWSDWGRNPTQRRRCRTAGARRRALCILNYCASRAEWTGKGIQGIKILYYNILFHKHPSF